MKHESKSRRKFMGRAVKGLLGGLALLSTRGDGPSGKPRPRHVSWRKAMYFAKTRRLAG